MNLADAIQRAHAENEQKLTAGIQIPIRLDSDAELLLAEFNKYCAFYGCRNIPASPKFVAAFVRSQKGSDPQRLIATLGAIEKFHEIHNLANPCATFVVREQLEKVLEIQPPRSWPRQEQLRFAELPAETRAIISRREKDRERELRRCQNEAADAKRAAMRLTETLVTPCARMMSNVVSAAIGWPVSVRHLGWKK